MSNWKEKRNYWKVKDCHGKVISHIIKIGDQQIEVSEEVFRCYSQGDRRERYILQDQKKSRFLSIEKLIQDEVKENYVGIPCTPSCQDIFIEQGEEAEWSRLKGNLLPALLSLNNDDRALITKLFKDGNILKGDTILDPTWNLVFHRYGGEPENFCRSYEEMRKRDVLEKDKTDTESHKNDEALASATLDLDKKSLREILILSHFFGRTVRGLFLSPLGIAL